MFHATVLFLQLKSEHFYEVSNIKKIVEYATVHLLFYLNKQINNLNCKLLLIAQIYFILIL